MARKKGGLGKGLEALLSEEQDLENTNHPETSEKFTEISSDKTKFPKGIEVDEDGGLWVDPALLKPNPQQPRRIFTEDDLEELADSIREHGIIQPIVIEDAGDGTFYIITGERRTRASRMIGLEKVPVLLKKFDKQKKLEVALIENIQRSDLNPLEEAQAYYRLMEIGGLNQEEVAKRVGKKRSTVANALRLLKLPEDMCKELINKRITAGHARALLSVVDPIDQRVLFGKILGMQMSVRDAEQYASELNNGVSAKKQKKVKPDIIKDPDVANLEHEFVDALGTKVVMKGSFDKGSLVIDYYSREDLDRLYNLILHTDK